MASRNLVSIADLTNGEIEEIFEINKPQFNKNIFRTEDEAHPGVAWLRDAGTHSIAGKVDVFPIEQHPVAVASLRARSVDGAPLRGTTPT